MLKRKIIAVFLLVCVLAGMTAFAVLPSKFSKNTVYTYKNTDFDAESITVPPEYAPEDKHIFELVIDENNYKDLDKYKNITRLIVSRLDFAELPSLAEKNIYYLKIFRCQNFDMAQVNKKRLKSFDAYDTDIKNFDCIAQCENLYSVVLDECEFGGAEAFKNTTQLEDVTIDNEPVENLDFLSGNKGLKSINISRSKISDLESVWQFEKLESLALTNAELSGRIDLSERKNLTDINFSDNKITEIILPEEPGALHSVNMSFNDLKSFDKKVIKNVNLYEGGTVELCGNLNFDYDDYRGFENVSLSDRNNSYPSIDEYIEYLNKINGIAEMVEEKCETDLEKALYTYWYLSTTLTYGFHTGDEESHSSMDPAYGSYGTIMEGLGVCLGFAYAYSDIMKLFGIDCYVYIGDRYSRTDDSAHAWNMVKIDGNYYHCDLTAGVSAFEYEKDDLPFAIIKDFGNDDEYMKEPGEYYLADKKAPKSESSLNTRELFEIFENISKR